MRKYFYLLFIFLPAIFSCNQQKAKNGIAFKNFHDHFAQHNFDLLEKDLADSILIYDEGGKRLPREKYISSIRDWAGIFNTKWNISASEQSGDTTRSVEFDTDLLKDHLYPQKMELRFTYISKNDQLIYLQWDTLPGARDKQLLAGMRYRAFASWVQNNYPDKYPFLSYRTPAAYIQLKNLLSAYLETLAGRRAPVVL